MRFAFIIHPIDQDMASLLEFDAGQAVRKRWGTDPLGVSAALHEVIAGARQQDQQQNGHAGRVRVVDELAGLVSPRGAQAEGRLYEIPMDAVSILEQPEQALDFLEEAVTAASQWGAELIGLGSMTAIIGGRGTHLAEHSPVAVTTGNSLTVYTALQNVYRAVEQVDIDLRQVTMAVVGIPGSIASAAATLLAPQCGELLLVGRRSSAPARKLADQLGAELLLDIPEALGRADVVLSATSTGNCIDQSQLKPGSLVVDVGVPTDVRGCRHQRRDVLILTGGLVGLPETMPWDSRFLWFQHGMVPSCLGETMTLALEGRAENFSLGRTLDIDAIQEIGSLARAQGVNYSKLHSFGHPLDDSTLIRFQKVRARMRPQRRTEGMHDNAERLADRAYERYSRHINPVLASMGQRGHFVKTFVRGEGAYLYDAEGNRYLDFVAGFGSLNLGHNHPTVAAGVQQALTDQAPGFAQSAVNPYAAALAERLVALAPAEMELLFPTNSGAESVEAALKLARLATGRTGFLYCEGAYHGKTMGALSVTGNPDYRRPFAPTVPECESVPFGDYEAMDRALSSRRFAALIVEPIQAEGGMQVPQTGYLREVQAVCRSTGSLLIVDEVQTGLGRTGTLFAVDREGVQPDVMTLAKSLGGGLMPLGAMLTRRSLWSQAYGSVERFALHTSTFSGGSLACAAGLAALEVLQQEDLPANADARGEQLRRGLEHLCREHACLKEVRGRGLLLGLEFQPLSENIKAHWRAADPTGMASYLAAGMERWMDSFHTLHAMQTLLHAHGIYTQVARSHPFVLRIEPPLTVSAQQVDTFLTALKDTCTEIDYSAGLFEGMIAKSSVGEHDAARRHSSSTVSHPDPSR